MSRVKYLFVFLPLIMPSLNSEAKAKLSPRVEVEKTLASYRQSRTFKAQVKKIITQELIGGEPTTSEGDFYFSKGRLRLEINKPEPTILVFDGKYIWFESRIGEGAEQKIVVSKMKSQQIKKSDSLLAVLFDNKEILKTFKLNEVKNLEVGKQFIFSPKDSKKSEVQRLELVLAPKAKEILSVTYTDTLDNKVEIHFSNTEKANVAKEKFSYKPPKGADVTEL